MNAILEPAICEVNQPLEDIVDAACKRVPPLWSLRNFVAVNPFVGFSDRHFVEAARLIQEVGHGEMLMPASYYREQIATGKMAEEHLQTAVGMAKASLPEQLAEKLNFRDLAVLERSLQKVEGETAGGRVLTFADFLDAKKGTSWAAFVLEEISKWCSAYFDQGQSSWRMPWRDLGLFAAWKSAARLDANPEWMGLENFRVFVGGLPDDHGECIDGVLRELGIPDELQPDFLHRQLMSQRGWSSYVQYSVREKAMAGQTDDSLAQLLAIRLAFDLALLQRFGNDENLIHEWEEEIASVQKAGDEIPQALLARFIAQQALECGYQDGLIRKLKTHSPQRAAAGQKALQAIFCIDVRSEVFRRALEAQSDQIETVGFAGFFGVAIEYRKFGQANGGAQCPVLLTPKFKVREALRHANGEAPLLRRMNFRQTVNGSWNAFKTSAISCFSFVETAGLWFGVKLVKNSLALAAPDLGFAKNNERRQFFPKAEREVCCAETQGFDGETGIAPAEQIALAAGALKHMGLVSNFAKVILICGLGSATANNPYGS
ncbi:MAG: putative inorganic carbon transporter subunit DabA, partial [Verrucomicrobiota bacterium]